MNKQEEVNFGVHHKLRFGIQPQDTLKNTQFKRWVFSSQQQRCLKPLLIFYVLLFSCLHKAKLVG